MDSEARIVACMQAAANDLNFQIPDVQRTRNIIGLGLREAVLQLFPWIDEALTAQMTLRYRHHFLNENTTPSRLFPGAAEAVRELADRGYLLAVATGKGRRGLDLVLESTGLADCFHATRCADETFSKPHPEMLQQIMDQLGVAPEKALMIGDTEYDLQMAKNAGVKSIAVSYGVHTVEKLLVHEPLFCLDDIRKIVECLAELERSWGGIGTKSADSGQRADKISR